MQTTEESPYLVSTTQSTGLHGAQEAAGTPILLKGPHNTASPTGEKVGFSQWDALLKEAAGHDTSKNLNKGNSHFSNFRSLYLTVAKS